jgi:hypothetical protein
MGSLQPIRASVRQLVLKPPEPSESQRQKTPTHRPRAENRKILSTSPLLECNRVGKRPVVAFRATPAPHAGDWRKDMGNGVWGMGSGEWGVGNDCVNCRVKNARRGG